MECRTFNIRGDIGVSKTCQDFGEINHRYFLLGGFVSLWPAIICCLNVKIFENLSLKYRTSLQGNFS
jgi:hypothetical protein